MDSQAYEFWELWWPNVIVTLVNGNEQHEGKKLMQILKKSLC